MDKKILDYLSGYGSIIQTRIYKIYQGMKQRCYNPNNCSYSHYGGRGIKICPLWIEEDGLYNFVSWSASNGYDDSLVIDRIDNDGDYSPDNCQWVTQSYNSSKGGYNFEKLGNSSAGDVVRKILLSQKITHTQLAERLGMKPQSLSNKINRGDMPIQDFSKILDELGYAVYIYDPSCNIKIPL